MKKTVIFSGSVVLAVAALGAFVQYDCKNRSADDLLLENVEALAGSEGDGGEEVQIPCALEKRRSCTFKSVDADGNEYVNTWNDYVKAG